MRWPWTISTEAPKKSCIAQFTPRWYQPTCTSWYVHSRQSWLRAWKHAGKGPVTRMYSTDGPTVGEPALTAPRDPCSRRAKMTKAATCAPVTSSSTIGQ